MPLGQEENPCRCLKRRRESEDRHCHPAYPLSKISTDGPLWAAVSLHLAIATVDLLHSVCQQDGPFHPALQSLQLGVPLQADIIATERDRHTEDTREVERSAM